MAKAPKKPAVKKSTALPAVPPHELDPAKVEAGQKQAIEFKIANNRQLQDKIESKISDLEDQKRQAESMKKFDHAMQVEGLIQKLTQLSKNVTKEIKSLKEQLKSLKATTPETQELINLLTSHCGEYLAQVKKAKEWLYRGSTGPDQYLGRSWNDRRPKDSRRDAQQLFDQMLQQQGFVALRSNSIYCTSDIFHASSFGNKVYVILPIDNHSHYTWTSHDDITLEFVDQVGMDYKKSQAWKDKVEKYLKSLTVAPADKKSYKALADAVSWRTTESAIDAVQQHVKKGNKFQIPPELSNVNLQDFITVQQFNMEYSPQRTDLYKAIKQGREVMIHGAYYALNTDVYGDILTQAFKVPVAKGW